MTDVTEHPAVVAAVAAIAALQADIEAGDIPELDGTARLACLITDLAVRVIDNEHNHAVALHLGCYSRQLAIHAAALIRQADLDTMADLKPPNDLSGLDDAD